MPDLRAGQTGYAPARNPAAFGLSVALHLAVAGAMLVVWREAPRILSASTPALTVNLVPLAAPDPVRDVAPGPEQVERQEERVEVQAEEAPVFTLQKVSIQPREERQEVAEPVDPGPPIPETTAPKSIQAPPAPRLSNMAEPDWEARLLAHLERFRRYPARARSARQQGTVLVRFKVTRGGQVLAAVIQRSSGFSGLDQAALETFGRAQPLPRLPEDRPDPLELTVPVEFYLR
ncbi:TonB family protein [Novosphingobium aerophilum]|uniref:TonB family protein n=1 Tax=Novosphingobium TaxID=165696 RepID=UPI0010F1E23A|nr:MULTISPECIES: energy transducer TonB [unclassified Novosphingobium]TCM41357.1 protein TonB [Novosphingobium sp. ST904]